MKRNRKTIRQRYRDLSLKKKLLSISLGACVFPVLLLQVWFTRISIRYMNEQIDEQIQNNLVQVSEKFSLTMESYKDMVYQIYTDKEVNKSLEKYHSAGKMERASLFYFLNERMKQFAETKKGIRCISLISRTGESITYDNQSGSALDNIWRDYEDLREIEPYKATEGKQEVVLMPTQVLPDQEEEAALFFLGKELYNMENLEGGPIGVLVIGIQAEELNNICNGSLEGSYKENSINFITDGEGRVLSFPDPSYIGTVLTEEQDECAFIKSSQNLDEGELFSSQYVDRETGWRFYNVYNRSYIMREVNRIQMVYFMLLLVDVFVVVSFVNMINRYFSKNLNQIMDGIHQVEQGNLEVQLEVNGQDEFGRIGENFNYMIGKVKALITEMTEISEKKKQAEIKALESQINPHFLYNTLDAINWMTIKKNEYEISKMISNLGYILRYSMNQSNEKVSISEWESWLKSYVSLYQLRYGYSFDFQIFVEPEVKQVKIYKLLLQPIVENAILHGMKDMQGGLLRVDIGLTEQSDRVHIIVEDNGVGMDPEKVKFYNRKDQVWTGAEGIGLANVFERIQLYYGKEGDWHISSEEGVGTIMELLLPIGQSEGERGEDQEDWNERDWNEKDWNEEEKVIE